MIRSISSKSPFETASLPFSAGCSFPASLAKLHEEIQYAMGWYDCHLHQFTIHGN
jgi:hypothetical protein